jgi:subtilisin family serine protease
MYKNGDLDVLSYNSKEELEAGLELLDADENVDSYQPNFSYESEAVTQTVTLTNDTYAKAQWALANNGTFTGYRTGVKAVSGVDIGAEKAWKYYTPKRDVVIALIDTGVQYTHSDLSGSFWSNTKEIAGNGIDDDGNGYVDDVNGWNFFNNNNQVYTGNTDAHGTHCAGTISATKDNTEGIAGLADYDNIKIMMLKALGGADGAGTTLSLARAIKYAEDNGASICNLSLGTETNDRILYSVMKNSKMLFVVAAGNGDGTGTGVDIDKRPTYPASYDIDNLITVANIEADGKMHASSDYGKVAVDLAAPGTDIVSTTIGGKYAYMTGTSMAAPFVTAAAAMVYSTNSELTLADTRNIILQTVKTNSSLTSKTSTGGMLDCGSAVAYAATGSTQNDDESESKVNLSNPSDTQSSQQQTTQTTTPVNQPKQQKDFSGSPFSIVNIPSGGWYGWNVRAEIPQFLRVIMGISGLSE